MGHRDPGRDRVARLLSYLELNRALRLLLHDNRSGSDMAALRNIADAKPDETTLAQLAIDR